MSTNALLEYARKQLWAQITAGYPRDPETRKTTYRVDEHNVEVLRELAHYLVKAPCQWAVDGCGLTLAGGRGTGKTDLMRAFSRTITTGGREGFDVVSAVEIVNLHDRSSRDERENGGSKVILQFGNRSTDLCIDDLGEEPEGKHFGSKRDVIAEIITLRYNLWKKRGILTHFTTNIVSDDVLLERYGDRATERILEMSRVVPLAGPSRRGSTPPTVHDRPQLFELPPPEPTEEELAVSKERALEVLARIKDTLAPAKQTVTEMRAFSSAQKAELDAFKATLPDTSQSELQRLIDRYMADDYPSVVKPYLDAIDAEVERREAVSE